MNEVQEFIQDTQEAASIALSCVSQFARLAKDAAKNALEDWMPQLPLSREVQEMTRLPLPDALQRAASGLAGKQLQSVATDAQVDTAVKAIQAMIDEMLEREKRFMAELETLEQAYQRNDMRPVDHYIENQLGLKPKGLCVTMQHHKLDEATMRQQLRIALLEFLKNKNEIIKGFHAKSSILSAKNYLIGMVKSWLFWKTQKWARNHVTCLKPWINMGSKARASAEIMNMSDFECEEEFSRLIEQAVQERYYKLLTPEALLIRQEEEADEAFAWQQRYALLRGLEQELANTQDPATKRLAELLELLLSKKYGRRCELLRLGFTESNWNALKWRIQRKARHLQPLAA